jgi:hypothetical protein
LPLVVQPHLPPPVVVTHVSPTLLPAQPVHDPPEAPHTPSARPVTQIPAPPSSSAQQPVLQAWVALQAVVHAWVVVLHDSFTGQSVGPLHPQAPAGPEPEMTHAVPTEPAAVLPAQLVHVVPPPPHSVCDSAVSHVPLVAELQHVPLQGWLDEHDEVHV